MKNDLNAVYQEVLEVGESPIWDIKQNRLLFIDIRGRSVYIGIPNADGFNKTSYPQQIGCVAICDNGDLLLAMEDGVYRTDESGALALAHQKVKIKGRRFNDGKIGPDGAFYLGTTDNDGQGAFYRLKEGILVELFDGCACSNGIEWTRDGKLMYYIDSPRQEIEVFNFDETVGKLSGRRKFIEIPSEWGLPDGMTLDGNDDIWVALWGGHRVLHIDNESGKIVEEIRVPCPKASSCAFGGDELSELYITTAAIGDAENYPEAGNVFKVNLNVKGKPINYYKW